MCSICCGSFPPCPFAGFLVLIVSGARLRRTGVAIVGAGSIAISAAIAFLIAARFSALPPDARVFTQTLWTWVRIDDFVPAVAFRLDALSLVMMLVVTGVSFLIHLYSTAFMEGDEGYARFFAYMNLFVGSMLVLVLADNLLLLYLGWEGVGLCSYLLIGFWYQDPINANAGRKAFIVTRVGDTAMAIGLFLIATRLGNARHPDADAASRCAVADRLRAADRRGRAAARRRGRQVGAVAAADLAARRDGRPDAGQRADPRRDDGDGGRLPDRAHARAVRRSRRRCSSPWRSSAPRRCCSPAAAPSRSPTSSACSRTRRSARSATCSSRSASAPGLPRSSTS